MHGVTSPLTPVIELFDECVIDAGSDVRDAGNSRTGTAPSTKVAAAVTDDVVEEEFSIFGKCSDPSGDGETKFSRIVAVLKLGKVDLEVAVDDDNNARAAAAKSMAV